MTLSDGQRFLMAANDAARGHDYFPWRVVGRRLDWPEARSRAVLASLGARKLVIALLGEETRLLPAGRALAEQLLARHPGGAGGAPGNG
jgi:hypothetical protein